jgi:hypothetical protein
MKHTQLLLEQYTNGLALQVNAAAVATVDWVATAKELESKSALEIMDHVSKHTGLPPCCCMYLANTTPMGTT